MSNQSGSAIGTEWANEILDNVKIPSLPEAASELISICKDAEASAADLVEVIELDPALTARLLKVANGAFFGQRGKVGTLSRAVVVLGNEYIRVAALGFYVTSTMKQVTPSGFDIREYWRDSVLRACLARQLANKLSNSPSEQAFVAGLLAEVGTLALASHFGQKYAECLQRCRWDWDRRLSVERSCLGVDHAEIGRLLAERWGFPDELIQAIGCHWNKPPMQKTVDTQQQLWQVAYFCSMLPFSMDRQTVKVPDSIRLLALSAFGLSFEGLASVFTETVEQFNAIQAVFTAVMPHECNAQAIMDEAAEMIAALEVENTEAISDAAAG